MELIRLNKYLAQIGIAARRKIDELIEKGNVSVNGKTAEMGQKINPDIDEIKINGNKIENKTEEYEYYMINKPRKVLCAVSDDSERKLITDYIKTDKRIFPVGRLDYETEGLLIVTNDGEIFNKIVHPKAELYKKYVVKIVGKITKEDIKTLKDGVILDDGITLPAKVKLIYQDEYNSTLKIEIREGRNRQIRRMFQALNYKVQYLKRVSVGKIDVGDLRPGEYRELTKDEIEYLQNL